MREVVSSAAPTPTSRRLTVLFVVLSLGLVWVSLAFALEVLGVGDPVVLGVNLGLGFALIAGMLVVYYRLFVPHRLALEQGEDLW